MTIAIVDYGVGNLGAIPNMLRRLDAVAEVTSDPRVVRAADKVILPGVGAFDAGMRRIRELDLEEPILARAADGAIVLGLCLGMELLFEGSEEGGEPGLALLPGQVVEFSFAAATSLPIPHMGWNHVRPRGTSPLLSGLGDEPRFYFAHSFHAVPASEGDVIAETTYGYPFASVVGRGNVMGAQFHPEKSHRFGLQLFRNFLSL